MEGFTDVSYVVERPRPDDRRPLFSGEIDMTMNAATEFVYTADGASAG